MSLLFATFGLVGLFAAWVVYHEIKGDLSKHKDVFHFGLFCSVVMAIVCWLIWG